MNAASEKRHGVVGMWVVAAIVLVLTMYVSRGYIEQVVFGDRDGASPMNESTGSRGAPTTVSVIMTGLDTPWETVRLPDGGLLVTERGGTLRWLEADGSKHSFEVEGTVEHGEGGLMGMALAPDFESSHHLYLYQTIRAGSGYANRVVRFVFEDGLKDAQVVVDGIPGAIYHNGGRITFGPDGMLYVATGDATRSSSAQDTKSLGGKVLRVRPDGSVPGDNPFGNAVWSYGHRNPQGLAWDDQGRLWATEHGRSGLQSGFDELNLIVKGGNYGWPSIEGDETREGMIVPVRHSGATVTWAPAGMGFANGQLYFAGLRGTAIFAARIDDGGNVIRFQEHFRREFGRLRSVRAEGHYLYVTTSNRDGRGQSLDGDDKLLRIQLDGLE